MYPMKDWKSVRFKLPHMSKEKFIQLMNSGIGYKKAPNGYFFIRDINNIDNAMNLLTKLFGEGILKPHCVICEKEFICAECRYYEDCPSRDLPLSCVCNECRELPNLYDKYINVQEQRRNVNG